MGNIVLAGATSGTTTLTPTAVSGTTTLTLPATTGTVLTSTALTTSVDANINGLTVGEGGSAVLSNTAVGNAALAINTTGTLNAAFGYYALAANTTGSGSTAVGYLALLSQTAGANQNTAIGSESLKANTTGFSNTALGRTSLVANTTGTDNGALGTFTLNSNTTGSYNTAVGTEALYSNTTATYNTAVGYRAGYNITTGTYNSILGSLDTVLTTGTHNIQIGRLANASSSSVSYALIINTDNTARTDKGSSTGFIFTGGSMYQGNNSASWATTSDARLKKNIVNNTTGLSAITQIQVRNFEYRLPEEITEVPQDQAIQKQGIQLGAIAQELKEILPDCVKTESTGVMSVDTTNLTWYLINAIKELNAKITALENKYVRTNT